MSSNLSQDEQNVSIFNGAFPDDVTEKYQVDEVLGRGSFGVVRKCKSKETGEEFALKTIMKSKVPDANILKREIQILQDADHPHIVKLYDVYETDKHIYLVTELCTGGELYDRVVEKTLSGKGQFSEDDAARIIRNILDAIRYCHDVIGVCHRDLKPENFLLKDKSDSSPVKVIDFGLGRYLGGNDVMKSQVGTIYYVAPEVLTQDSYTAKCDLWSIGVVTYVLLCGYPPFNAGNEMATYKLVEAGEVKFPSPAWDHISQEAIEFIRRLMYLDPEVRPSAREALEDPWLQQEEIQPECAERRASFLPCLTRYARKTTYLIYPDVEKRTAFGDFLRRIKLGKQTSSESYSSERSPMRKPRR